MYPIVYHRLECAKCSEFFRSRNPYQKLCWNCLHGPDVADRQARRRRNKKPGFSNGPGRKK